MELLKNAAYAESNAFLKRDYLILMPVALCALHSLHGILRFNSTPFDWMCAFATAADTQAEEAYGDGVL